MITSTANHLSFTAFEEVYGPEKRGKRVHINTIKEKIGLQDISVGENIEGKYTIFCKTHTGNLLGIPLGDLNNFEFEPENGDFRGGYYTVKISLNHHFLYQNKAISSITGALDYECVQGILCGYLGHKLPLFVIDYLKQNAYDRGHSAGYSEVVSILRGSLMEMEGARQQRDN